MAKAKEAPVKDERIAVRATQNGVFGHFREGGSEFTIPSMKQFSKRWMELVDKPAEADASAEE